MLDSNFEIVTLTKSTKLIVFIMYVVPSTLFAGSTAVSEGLSECTGK
jgi:hypothetical protein